MWPNGDAAHRPTPVLFSSPSTGAALNQPYQRAAFEANLPRVEAPDLGGICDRSTGANCTLIPRTDDKSPAAFYPYFSTVSTTGGCRWGIGSTLPGTISNFGANSQYGQLLPLAYTSGHGTVTRFNDFRNVLPNMPC